MSALSRKFFVALAERFKAQQPSPHAQSWDMWVDMVMAASSAIAEGNPAFDRRRFLMACGFTADQVASIVAG